MSPDFIVNFIILFMKALTYRLNKNQRAMEALTYKLDE